MYDKVMSLFEEAWEGRKPSLGDRHLDALKITNDLAVPYREQARYEEAEALLIEILNGRWLRLRNNHAVESLKQLIILHEAWNKPEEADKWRAKLPETEALEK